MEEHKKKYLYIGISGFILSFVITLIMFFPLFNNKSGLDVITDFFNGNEKIVKKLGDEPPDVPMPYLYEHFIPPSNSFGIGEHTIKKVNWSFFWSKFRDNSRWNMEGWHPIQEEWVDNYQGNDLDNYLNISKIRSGDNSSEKITLNFTSPYTTKYRFTFGIDARVLQYVNKTDKMEYKLVYPINGTDDNYTVFFNWSDLIPMLDNNTIRVNHGLKNINGRDVFWFRIITNVDLQQGNSYDLDPTFGYTVTGTFTGLINDYSDADTRGIYALVSNGDGIVDNITVNFAQYADGPFNIRCALYQYVDYTVHYAGDLIKTTEVVSVNGNGNFVFPFNATKPSVTNNTNYYLLVMPTQNYRDSNDRLNIVAQNSGNKGVYDISRNGDFPANFFGESASTYTYHIYASYTVGGEPPEGDSWNTIIDTINGSWVNTTKHYEIDTTTNGSWVNITKYYEINPNINGSWTNTSKPANPSWNNISNTINGSWTNTSQPANPSWNNIDNTINGTWINGTGLNGTTNNSINIVYRQTNQGIYLLIGFLIGFITIFMVSSKKKKE